MQRAIFALDVAISRQQTAPLNVFLSRTFQKNNSFSLSLALVSRARHCSLSALTLYQTALSGPLRCDLRTLQLNNLTLSLAHPVKHRARADSTSLSLSRNARSREHVCILHPLEMAL